MGPQIVGQGLDREVLVGKEARLPARLLMVRVPDAVVEKRQARIKADARRRGQAQASPPSLARATWTMWLVRSSRSVRCWFCNALAGRLNASSGFGNNMAR